MKERPPITLKCNDLSVQFHWTGDRYRHDILLGDTIASSSVVASSIEGDSSDDVPPSPPLQDLSLESLGTGPDGHEILAIMGVGGAGRGHWSISVTRDRPDGLLFELACRGSVPKLGNEYKIVGDVTIEPLPTATVSSAGHVEPVERLVGTTVWSYIVRRSKA